MSDVFNVTAAYDKSSYNAGDTIKVTISGTDVHTTTSTVQTGALDIPVVSVPDNVPSTLHVPPTMVTLTTVANESVVIDTTRPIVDSGSPPRTWVVSADKLSITAIA